MNAAKVTKVKHSYPRYVEPYKPLLQEFARASVHFVLRGLLGCLIWAVLIYLAFRL